MATEFRKIGATVDEGPDFLRITPSIDKNLTSHVAISTYNDHRMAMCFSLVSLGAPVRINDPDCVSKTFPSYFEKFAEIVKY
jgi:3-phosphoshikimate 1-carboxyvinyltransferase